MEARIPTDMCQDAQSKAAAQAAIRKALTVVDPATAELLMAWFYAGYHAAKVAASASHGEPGGKSS